MPTEELRATRESQIVEGALPLFLANGFHGTSIRQIAEASGLSMGGLYEYIASKDDVLSLVYCRLAGLTAPSVSRDPVPWTDRVGRLLESVIGRGDEVRLLYRETSSLDAGHREELARSEVANAHRIADLLQEGIDAGDLECDDPLLTAHLLGFLMAFIPLRGWLLRRDGLGDFDGAVAGLTRLIIRALRPSDAPARPAPDRGPRSTPR